MKRWGWASLVMIALLIATVATSEAGGRHHRHGRGPRVFVGLGVGFGPVWWNHYPYWHYPYYPAYVYGPPVVVQQQPTVYVEQPVPPASSAPPAPPQYWYYCERAAAYYPTVPTCDEPWVKVPARAQP
jgi:hypothetical protein